MTILRDARLLTHCTSITSIIIKEAWAWLLFRVFSACGLQGRLHRRPSAGFRSRSAWVLRERESFSRGVGLPPIHGAHGFTLGWAAFAHTKHSGLVQGSGTSSSLRMRMPNGLQGWESTTLSGAAVLKSRSSPSGKRFWTEDARAGEVYGGLGVAVSVSGPGAVEDPAVAREYFG